MALWYLLFLLHVTVSVCSQSLSAVCQKSDRAMNKCPLLPSHKNTWQKKVALSLLSHVFEV